MFKLSSLGRSPQATDQSQAHDGIEQPSSILSTLLHFVEDA